MFEEAGLRTALQTFHMCAGVSQRLMQKRSLPTAIEWYNPKSAKLERIRFKEVI